MRVRYPKTAADFVDFRTTMREHVLNGFIPATPPLSRSDRVLTQGSCFAANIHDALVRAGISSTHSSIMEIANTPRANRELFECALGKRSIPPELNSDVPTQIRAVLEASRALIFTVGLIYEPWKNGRVQFDLSAGDIQWRKSTLPENVDHLRAIIALAKEANPALSVVLTLSPIPVGSVYGQTSSAIVADCVSKSTLRTAIDHILADGSATYWPSFEAVRWLSGHLGQMFGRDGEDHRHLSPAIVQPIVDEFIGAYFGSTGE